MGGRSPQPRRLAIGVVVREAAGAYRAHAKGLLLTAAVVFIPLGLLEAGIHGVEELHAEDGSAGAIAGLAGAALVVAFTATLGDVFYTGVVAAVVSARRTGTRRGLARVARTLPYGRLLAVDVLFALMVAVGLLLLVAPGVIAFTWFVLAAPTVEIERRGVRDAFGRSRELVQGNFWRVFGLLAPVVIASDELGRLVLSGGPWLLGDGFFGDWLGSTLEKTLTVPLFALPAVVTTHHLIAMAPRWTGRPVS